MATLRLFNARAHGGARSRGLVLTRLLGLLLLWAPSSSVVAGASLAACRADGPAQLEPACLEALAQVSPQEALGLIEPWIVGRSYGRAQAVLSYVLTRNPGDVNLARRVQEVQSLADEAAWLARKDRSATSASREVDLALAETTCTRLTGVTALAACEQVLGARPGDAKILATKGDLLLTLGRHNEAVAAYKDSVAQQPNAALLQKISLLEGISQPRSPTLDQQLAALETARKKKLITKVEYDKQRLAMLAPPVPTAVAPAPQAGARSAAVPGLDFGRYHALVIGNNAYRHLPKLDTAVGDARAIAEVLKSAYAFEVKLMTDATRADIVEVLDDYRAKLQSEDNLVIYYAGHGWLDSEADKGFWLPVDARENKRTQWVSNDTIRDALRALKAKHVLVIADSCFSGTLTRGLPTKPNRDQDYLKRMTMRKARQVIASGGLEPVADSAGGGHSPFAAALLEALKTNTGVLDGTSLFADLRRPVAVNSEQVPQFADIRQAGHQGGDFMFVRKK